MRKTIALAGAFLLSLQGCVEQASATVDRSTLIAERKAKLAEIEANPGPMNPTLECAAKKVMGSTAETLLLMMVNERSDLTTKGERKAASQDMVLQIEECGGDLYAAGREVEETGDLVFYAYAYAILKAGRGVGQ